MRPARRWTSLRLLLSGLAATVAFSPAVLAQTAPSFEALMEEVVAMTAEAELAAHPAACGGVMRAMALILETDDPETAQAYSALEADASITAAILLLDARGLSQDAAIDAAIALVQDVSVLFITHFSDNRAATGSGLTPEVEGFIMDCRDQIASWREATG